MNKPFERSDAQIISRLFFRLLPAQAFMLALNGLNNMIDGLVGSNFVGAKAMSAIGIYTPLQMACMAVSMILMASSQVLCGRYMGEGRMEKTRGVFSLNLTIALAFTATVTLASFLIPRSLAGLLGATQENMADVSSYIIGRGIGVIPLLLGQQLASFLQLERQSMRNYVATGLMLVVNAGFDLLFAAVLDMGAMGLGIATSLSNWAYLAVVGSFFLMPRATLKYSVRAIDWSEIASMVRIGFPSALLIFLTALRSTIFNRMLAAHATLEAVAALATFNMVYILFSAMVSGISTTGRILASVSYGEEDRRSLTLLMRTILTKGYAIVLLTAALEFLLAGVFTGLYYSDHTSAVYAMTLSGIRWGSLFLLLQIFASIFSSYYQALGRIKVVNAFSLMEGIAVMGPLAVALVPRMGLDGLWITMLAGYAVTALFAAAYAVIYWKRLPKTLEEWITLPPDFGAAEEQRLDITIHSMDEVTATSERVLAFCSGRGIERRRAYYSALCLEEMAANIVKHGFHADNKPHAVDVRVVHKGEDVILRVKDDCAPFNPRERAELLDAQDMARNIGLRMVMRIAKSVDYQNLLGLNVLTMRV